MNKLISAYEGFKELVLGALLMLAIMSLPNSNDDDDWPNGCAA